MPPTRPDQARLAPVADPDEQQRELMTTAVQRGETPLAIFATLAHNPGLLRRVSALGGRFLFRSGLPDRAREIVILRSAYRSGSEYEFGQHTIIGAAAGLSEQEIRRLARPDAGAGWSDREQALLAMVDELAAEDCVSEATWARLREQYDDAGLVEVLLLPGFYRMLAGFLNSAGVQRDDGVPGWPDAGRLE